jgi:hypothetical protein
VGAMLSRRVLLAVVTAVLGVLASASVASADTYTVNDPTDAALATSTDTNCVSTNGGSCTLRAAVQAADNAGAANPGTAVSIRLPAGAYTLTIPPADYTTVPACTTTYDDGGGGCDSDDPANGDLDVLNGTTLTITGAGSGTTTINANGIDRAFAVQSGGSLSLSGVTIENGQPYGPYCYSTYYAATYSCSPSSGGGDGPVGGAIYSDGALTTTGDVIFSANQAPIEFNQSYGGAIYADADTTALSLSGSTFTGNYANQGSAIYDTAPVAATISGSAFTDNDTGGGDGTIYGEYETDTEPSLSITASTFSGNIAGDGGAIYWDSQGDLTADGGNTFTGNSAAGGGVLWNEYWGHATSLSGDVIKDNTAYDAGVIYEDDYSGSGTDSVALNNDEIDDNTATYVGVGYFSDGAGPTSVDSSYVGNSGADGGVFYLSDTSDYGQGSSLTNVTMSGNSSTYGGALYVDSTATNPLTLVNDTIAFNTATAGGGIYGAYNASPGNDGGVTNTIVAENSGGDCGGTGATQFPAAEDSGYNDDSDGSCFGYSGHPSSDEVGVNPALSQAAGNGGPNPVQTDAEHAGGPTVNAGSNDACPATDARGLARPQTAADPCDIGAFELVGAGLSLTNAAPSSASASLPFNETLTVSAAAASGPSTGTTVVDQLPAGETLYGATPSQGSCSSSGSPAKVTCALGLLAPGSSATVLLVVAEANAVTVTNTATASNDEGSSVSAAAATQIAGAATPPPPGAGRPVAYTGLATGIGKTTATVAGVVDPGAQSTVFFFQYGLNTRYGASSTAGAAGSAQEDVVAALSHLSQATTYHYRLVAINNSGISYGADAKFKTTGTAALGTVLLDSVRLAVKSGKVRIPLTCSSSKRCLGAVSITTRVKKTATGRTTTVRCTVTTSGKYSIRAHRRNVVKVGLRATCAQALTSNRGKLSVKVSVTSRSGQKGVVKLATLHT